MYKLSTDHTAVNRRDVLKGIVGAVGSTVLPTGAIGEVAKAVTSGSFNPFVKGQVALNIMWSLFPDVYLGDPANVHSVDDAVNLAKNFLDITPEIERQIRVLGEKYLPILGPRQFPTVDEYNDFRTKLEDMYEALETAPDSDRPRLLQQLTEFRQNDPDCGTYQYVLNLKDPRVLRVREQIKPIIEKYRQDALNASSDQDLLDQADEARYKLTDTNDWYTEDDDSDNFPNDEEDWFA